MIAFLYLPKNITLNLYKMLMNSQIKHDSCFTLLYKSLLNTIDEKEAENALKIPSSLIMETLL